MPRELRPSTLTITGRSSRMWDRKRVTRMTGWDANQPGLIKSSLRAALSADRTGALGIGRSLVGHTGQLGRHLRCGRHRRNHACGLQRRPIPRVSFFPQSDLFGDELSQYHRPERRFHQAGMVCVASRHAGDPLSVPHTTGAPRDRQSRRTQFARHSPRFPLKIGSDDSCAKTMPVPRPAFDRRWAGFPEQTRCRLTGESLPTAAINPTRCARSRRNLFPDSQKVLMVIKMRILGGKRPC